MVVIANASMSDSLIFGSLLNANVSLVCCVCNHIHALFCGDVGSFITLFDVDGANNDSNVNKGATLLLLSLPPLSSNTNVVSNTNVPHVTIPTTNNTLTRRNHFIICCVRC